VLRLTARRLLTLAAASALASSGPALAAPAPPEVVRVWYRSSAGCPDGAAFIALLQRFGRQGELASVGDRVDFVVTVAHAPSQSTGRLERQSSEQTVAIRDVAAASCDEAAEVLALSLELALQPAVTAAPDVVPNAVPDAARPPPAPTIARVAEPSWQPRLGAQATFVSGVARAALPGAALFFDLRPSRGAWSGRVSLRGARGERDAAIGLGLWLLAARAEACWGWPFGALSLGPCGGLDAGVLRVEGAGDAGRSDDGFWGSAVLHARLGWQLGRALTLEAQAGALVPFVRHRFEAATGGEVERSAPVGADVALGVSLAL
jgi:hypothetical protein